MAFLIEGSKFPPENWEFWYDKYFEYSAWYSGDSSYLADFYSSQLYNPVDSNSIFWSRLELEERAMACNMPAAGDIAAVSANLLFSEIPDIKFDEKSIAGDRINTFFEDNGIFNFFLESAEIAAALSGCFLKIEYDNRFSEFPIVSTIIPQNAFPTFIRGRLWEVLFWREVRSEKGGSIIYRLFENRSRSLDGKNLLIQYKLYKGNDKSVGKEISIDSIEETRSLMLQDVELKNVYGLGVVYVPNMRPNRLLPGSNLGINDFNGSIPLMDSLDLSWTSLIRDIDNGLGRLFIDEELFQKEEDTILGDNKSNTRSFNMLERCFIKLNFSSSKYGSESYKPIENVQFEMRIEEHLTACESIFKNIVSMCGYSPSTFGFNTDGRAESGTALRIRERKSFLTREKKSRYWQQCIKELILQMQTFDNAVRNSSLIEVLEDATVELQDSIVTDYTELSNVIKNLDQARAISTKMKVMTLHPDWDISKIDEEVNNIIKEEGLSNDNMFNFDEPNQDDNQNNGDNLNE